MRLKISNDEAENSDELERAARNHSEIMLGPFGPRVNKIQLKMSRSPLPRSSYRKDFVAELTVTTRRGSVAVRTQDSDPYVSIARAFVRARKGVFRRLSIPAAAAMH